MFDKKRIAYSYQSSPHVSIKKTFGTEWYTFKEIFSVLLSTGLILLRILYSNMFVSSPVYGYEVCKSYLNHIVDTLSKELGIAALLVSMIIILGFCSS